MHILIFKVSPLGDTVMFLPAVQALQRVFPEWRISVFVAPVAAEIFRSTIAREDLFVVERGALQKSWRRPWRLLRWWRIMRRLQPDAALLSFDQSSVARFLVMASGARVRVGGAGAVVRFKRGLSHEIPLERGQSVAAWEWAMAEAMVRALGHTWPPGPPAPLLPRTEVALEKHRPRVVLHVGSSRDYQRWSPERCVELAQRLSHRYEVVWIERPEIALVAPNGVHRFAARTLAEFAGLLEQTDLLVSFHSGALHLASAIGCPTVVLAGPALYACDPVWNRERIRILRAPGLRCLPCDRMPVSPDRCTNDASPMACMQYWTVDAVEQVCTEWLARFLRPTDARFAGP